MAGFLIDHGAPVDERPTASDAYQGETPLMIAAADGLIDVATLLLERGASAEARNASGLTPLHFAVGSADRGTSQMVELLLAAGADPGATDESGATALALAREFGVAAAIAALERAEAGAPAERSGG